ncbi:MAG: LytTR family DNA-binding domain-containing protein, partial [Xanthomonadales bacterium]|nr:LytTR family DNA-binding domain-containing protein [Xanthomonadales bacterium]
ALPSLGAVTHSIGTVILSYLVEGYSADRPFAEVFGFQLVKKAPLNLSIFLAVTVFMLFVRALRASRQTASNQQQPIADRLVIPTPRGEALVRLEEIDRIEAEGNYVAIHAGERKYLERRTMREAERRLAEAGFARIHRSHLVNLERLERVERTAGGTYRAVLADGTRLPMSRSYRKRLKKHLG